MISRSLIRGAVASTSARLTQRTGSALISTRLNFLFRTSPSLRFNSTESNSTNNAQIKVDKPELMLAFKCKKCDNRSSHIISKQAYTKGTVLVTCPGCQNRHLISDHLKIFSDDRITIQDILSAKGESISQSTDDLIFDEIPERLKDLIGHHAKDAPDQASDKASNNDQDSTKFLTDEK